MGGNLDRLPAPTSLLADLMTGISEALRGEFQRIMTILYIGTEPYDRATVPSMTLNV